MEMHQIRYFLAVSETLNFTRAAEKCHVSQPALTRAIKTLEDELGGPLFHRERQNTHLTELGRMMLPFLQDALDQSRKAKAQAKAFSTLAQAPLSVGVMVTIGPHRLLDLFENYREGNPGVDVRMHDATGKELVEKLAAGDLDVAIFGLPDAIDERFHCIKLYDERYVVGMAPGHPLAAANGVRLADMDGQRYLGRLACEFWDFFARRYEELGVNLNLTYRSQREDWIQAMIRAGWGISAIPEHAVVSDGIVVRPFVDPPVMRTVYLVTVRGRPHTPAIGAFVREAVRWRDGLASAPAALAHPAAKPKRRAAAH